MFYLRIFVHHVTKLVASCIGEKLILKHHYIDQLRCPVVTYMNHILSVFLEYRIMLNSRTCLNKCAPQFFVCPSGIIYLRSDPLLSQIDRVSDVEMARVCLFGRVVVGASLTGCIMCVAVCRSIQSPPFTNCQLN